MDEYISLERIADAAELRALLQVLDTQNPEAGGVEQVAGAIGVLVRRILLRTLAPIAAAPVLAAVEVDRAAVG